MPKEVDGTSYIRVTELCNLVKPIDPLINAAIKITLEKQTAEAWGEYCDEAMQKGTDAHSAIEQYLKQGTGENPVLPALKKWMDEYNVRTLETEVQLTSSKYGYTGTCDYVCLIDKLRYIVDFKTSKAIYDGYDMQVALYALCYDETHIDKIDGIAVLRISPDGVDVEFKDFTKRRQRAEDAALSLLNYWYIYKDRKLVNNEHAKSIKEDYKNSTYLRLHVSRKG